MPTPQEIRGALRNPLSWIVGTIASVLAIAASLGVDPITGGIIIGTVVWNNLMTVFTATSILGFTVAPEVGILDARPFKVAAVILGFLVVGQIAGEIWDNIERRVR